MRAALICLVVALSGCASQGSGGSADERTGASTFTISCEDNWSDCYSDAKKVCGDGDFDEVDRHGTSSIVHSRSGTPNRASREQADIGMMNRSITFRCN